MTELYNTYLQHPVVCTDTRAIVPDSLFFCVCACGGFVHSGIIARGCRIVRGFVWHVISFPDRHFRQLISGLVDSVVQKSE